MEVLDTVNDEIEQDCEARDEGDEGSESDGSSDSEKENESSSAETSIRSASNPDSPSTQSKPKKLLSHTNDASSDSNSNSSSEGPPTKNPIKKVKNKAKELVESHNASDDGSRGAIGQIEDYKDHRKQLHRKHKGIMQWKATRTADWALGKARNGQSRVSEVFEHQEKSAGIETEV